MRVAAVLAVMLLLGGFGSPQRVAAVGATAGGEYDVGATELMRILNYERAKVALAPLQVDPFLADKARDGVVACPDDPSRVMEGRAKDLAVNGYAGINPHYLRLCPTISIGDAMYGWGYAGQVGEIYSWNWSSQPVTVPWRYPIACGDLGSPVCEFVTYMTVSEAASAFMESTPHRANVLGAYDRFGCGAWVAPAGSLYPGSYHYVCMFASGGPNSTVAPPTTAPVFVPRAPTEVEAVADEAAAIVSWDATVGVIASPISRYTATASPGGRSCIASGSLTCTVTGLSAGTPYTFRVRATNDEGTGPASARSNSVTPRAAAIASTFHPTSPARILDTRSGLGLSGRFRVNVPRSFRVTGKGGVPTNATAVTGNLTVTGSTGSGWLTLGPTVSATTNVSTLNFPKGDNRANNVTVRLGPGGVLGAVYAGGAGGTTTDVVFDVTGYFTPDDTGATYHPKTPVRLLDSRSGNGLSGPFRTITPRTFQVTGRRGIPDSATAVTGNLTVVDQTTAGYAFLGPTAKAVPPSSTLNLPAGDTRANGVTVKLGAGGTLGAVWVGKPGSTAQLVFDLTGYFTADGSGMHYFAVEPVRVVDSRIWLGMTGAAWSLDIETIAIRDSGLVSATAAGISANLTIVSQTTKGYAFLGPVVPEVPTSSTINAPKGDVRANGLDVALSPSGDVGIMWVAKGGSRANFILDVTGYWK